MRELHTANEIIDALGGTKKTAEFVEDISAQAVSHWRRKNRLPPLTYWKIIEKLEALGLTAPRSLWGFQE